MKLLLTNDDGVGAPGLDALLELAGEFGDCTIAAPEREMSGCGHQVTTHAPLRLKSHGADHWSIDGAPADCVRVALHSLSYDFDWVISGINPGGNLGADTYISGTIAAAREAAFHGLRSIALSHYRLKDREIRWPEALDWLRPVLADLMARPLDPGAFWNVNLPHLLPGSPRPAVVHCPIDPSPLPLSYRRMAGDHPTDESFHYDGVYHERARRPGSDIDICFGGSIAVTLLRVG